VAQVESSPKQDGRNMIMVIAPTKKAAVKVDEREATPEPAPITE
jgi:hypothetical protein